MITQRQRISLRVPFALLFVLSVGLVPIAVGDTERLIEQLGDKSFYTREKAMAALIAAGPVVEPQVRAALEHSDAEVRYRSEKVLIEIDKSQRAGRRAAFLEGDIGKLKSNVKSWERLSKLVGNSPKSRELFLSMLNGGEELLTAAEKGGSGSSALITQLYTAQSAARRVGEEAISPGGVLAMLFVASDKTVQLDSSANSRVMSLLSQYRSRMDAKNPAFQKLMGHLVKSATGSRQYQMLRMADQFNLKEEGLTLARKMVGSGHSSYRAQAMIMIGKHGDKKDIATLAKFVNDGTALSNQVVRNGKKRETKLGDVALAMSIVLSGEKPKDYGFPDAPAGRPTSTSYYNYGFFDKEKRAAAQKKWQAKLDSDE